MKKEIFTKKFLAALLILLAAGACLTTYLYKRIDKADQSSEEDAVPDRIYKVKRGDMIIGVMLTGSVNSKVKHKLAMEAPFSTKLVKIVDENAPVKKGDRVAEYETSDLLQKIEDLKVLHDNKKKDLEIALEELEILKSSNEADIRSAIDSVSSAEDAYNKYWRLEGPRDKDTQRMNVESAQTTMDEAKDSWDDLQNDYDQTTFSSEAEETKALANIESAKQKYESAQTKYESAVLERKIFRRYTYPNKMKTLRNALIQAKLNLNKVKVKTQSSLQQKNNQVFQIQTQIRNYERDLERYTSYVPMMTLKAPVDGIVTYGDPDQRWGRVEVKVGMDAHRKQVIITIPDMSQMIVDVNLPEQYRSKISENNEVIITPESIQTIKLKGKIESIASLPVNMIPWDQNSPKIYRTVVGFSSYDPRVVSGMSVQVEVVSKILKNVISIPIEAVFEEGGKLIVYKKTYSGPEKVAVTINESNNNSVEVTGGLEENDEVYLYRPFETGRK